MKKIPTLFERRFENHKVVDIIPCINEELVTAFQFGDATVKYDGSCCAVIKGELYKRFDFKPGRKLPENAIPCQEKADPVTGHFPHWVKCNRNDPSDRWFFKALDFVLEHNAIVPDGTYEAIGEHFNGNPYNLRDDRLVRHGVCFANVERSYDTIRNWLATHDHEGLVFWYDGKPVCKIKRTDFGFEWPIRSKEIKL